MAGLVRKDHHSTRLLVVDVMLGSASQTDMFCYQNFGTTLPQEKHSAFVQAHDRDVCRQKESFRTSHKCAFATAGRERVRSLLARMCGIVVLLEVTRIRATFQAL